MLVGYEKTRCAWKDGHCSGIVDAVESNTIIIGRFGIRDQIKEFCWNGFGFDMRARIGSHSVLIMLNDELDRSLHGSRNLLACRQYSSST